MIEDYDVVVAVLTEHRDKLQKMTNQNLCSEFVRLNIMDDIRLGQVSEINKCLNMWVKYKNPSNSRDFYTNNCYITKQ